MSMIAEAIVEGYSAERELMKVPSGSLALFRPQAGKEVSGFNFLRLIIYIYQQYRIYIYR